MSDAPQPMRVGVGPGLAASMRSRIGAIIATLLGVAYYCWGAWKNLQPALDAQRYDGDHAQAVAHYWRYHVEGAMPAGDLLTDYAFLMHAPLGWWAPMALLSTVVTPLAAAKLLSLVAYAATGAFAWLLVYRKGNVYLAAATLVLIARCSACHFFLAGGYARSFGPPLVLLFLCAWVLWSHRAVLVVLVLQAALYPSVVIACGLAYGAYCVLAGPMNARIKRCATLALAGVVIIALGMMQDLRAPKEWGSVVWLEDALEMPAWGPGGRIQEAPLRPVSSEIWKNLIRPYTTHGDAPLRKLVPGASSMMRNAKTFVYAWAAFFVLVVARRIWRGGAYGFVIPWQLPALFLGALVGYFVARALAFKLYLPYRVLAHSWVWIMILLMPLVAYEVGMWIFRGRSGRATAFALVLSLVPAIGFLGHGLALVPGIYTNTGADRARLHAWLRKNTPVDATFAGDLGTMDRIPLFAYRQVLVNRALAHPFRPGFYQLTEDRVRETYEALYADDPAALVAFADKWSVEYIVYSTDAFTKVDKRVFEPVRRDVAKLFRANKPKGFAVDKVPPSAVVFKHKKVRVIDVARLRNAPDVPSTPDAANTLDVPVEADDVDDAADDATDADDSPTDAP